jgi:hypothetical protein
MIANPMVSMEVTPTEERGIVVNTISKEQIAVPGVRDLVAEAGSKTPVAHIGRVGEALEVLRKAQESEESEELEIRKNETPRHDPPTPTDDYGDPTDGGYVRAIAKELSSEEALDAIDEARIAYNVASAREAAAEKVPVAPLPMSAAISAALANPSAPPPKITPTEYVETALEGIRRTSSVSALDDWWKKERATRTNIGLSSDQIEKLQSARNARIKALASGVVTHA